MTIARDQLVEWWPLVDVTRLRIREGDLVIVRIAEGRQLTAAQVERIADALHDAYPLCPALVVDNGIDFVLRRAMPDMRAEDLIQPKRTTTME
jgi:hypothetical protein